MATVDVSFFLQGVLDSLLDNATLTEVCTVFAEKCDPYVPFKTGALSESGLSGACPEGVRYDVPYAATQYYGVGIAHNPEFHPLATALWDKVMMQNQGEEFYDEVQEILLRRARELYG